MKNNMMKSLVKGVMTGGTAIAAVTMLPVAGAIGTITMTGAAITGAAGFVIGSMSKDIEEIKERNTDNYRLVCEDLLGNLVLSVTKEDEVYYMFNYVYGKLELMNDNTVAVLDRDKFKDESIYNELMADNRSSKEYNEMKKEAAEYVYGLFVGYVKLAKDSKKIDADKIKVLQANLKKVKEVLL